MVHYFPKPRPDESLYSVIAWYADHTLTGSPKILSRLLFGFDQVKACVDLPGHIDSFHKQVGLVFPYSIRETIYQFTLYHYYYHFMTHQKRQAVYNSMVSSTANSIHTRIGINASKMKRSRFPYFCPLCIIEDREIYGEPYFHLLHQIPDLNVCTKHSCHLNAIQARPDNLNHSLYLCPRKELIDPTVRQVKTNLFLSVARAIEDIYGGRKVFDISCVNYNNSNPIIRFRRGKTLDRIMLENDFVEFFGLPNLRILLGEGTRTFSWVSDIVQRPTHVFHPMKHLLLQTYIDEQPMIFVPKLLHPFGNGPWKCFNKASSHFLKDVVVEMKHHKDPKTRRHIGVFSCSCGMVYTKSQVLSKNGKMQEFIRIREWGEIWKGRLAAESKLGKGIRHLSRAMGADPKIIKRFVSGEMKVKPIKPDNSVASQRKVMWTSLLNGFPRNQVKLSRTADPRLYAWLYRNCYEWLIETNKRYRNRRSSTRKLNWEKLDSVIRAELEKALDLLTTSRPLLRITRTLLATFTGRDHYLLGRNTSRLPLSDSFIKTAIESVEDYQKRRILIISKELGEQEPPLIEWKVMRKAGLKNPLSKPVRAFLTQVVKKKQNGE